MYPYEDNSCIEKKVKKRVNVVVIVNTKGGLGNQMFQYALYITLKTHGKCAKICTDHFEWAISEKRNLIQPHGKIFLIEDVFATKAIKATKSEARHLSSAGMDISTRLKRRMGFVKKTHYSEEVMGYPSIERLLSLDDVFLDGYWQRFDYYETVENEIRRAFRFRNPLIGKNKMLADQIGDQDAVSIHVRRNDYLSVSGYVVQNVEYYRNAMKRISEKYKNPVYYCFSDDIDWCRKHLPFDREVVFVDWNTGNFSYYDMQLMSLCKANIIANSTFSLWAAWLNNNTDKTVVRPKHYYIDEVADGNVYWPKDWIAV